MRICRKKIGKAFIEVYTKNADNNCKSYEEAVRYVTDISQKTVIPVTHTDGFRKKNHPYPNQDNNTSGSYELCSDFVPEPARVLCINDRNECWNNEVHQ